ncbi:hypothetical protein FHX08_001020 [Rhizobium sp. BK529]|uniref:hypothetical protein n=1 Tax=Rhizobium sp. BK529 TaxID=2586983 RepID=UPI00161D1772|nr:hypothetical protein [Rhizobium sp. BK529]MBB3590676.1 hypothetical protein [Rhizobium sp. BK529]
MTAMLSRHLFPAVLRSAEGSGSGGGDAGASASPENILFPDDAASPDGDNGSHNGDDLADHDAGKPDDTKDDDPADRVPDDGRYTLTMPEGIEVDQELIDALGPDFHNLGLTNRQAQQLADRFIEIQGRRGRAASEAWAGRVQGWADEARKDREIGGAKWAGTVGSAQRALSRLGTPALREYLNTSGGGNHPEMIRIFAKVGSMIQEDNPPNGGAGGNGRKAETAHLMFPKDAPKG